MNAHVGDLGAKARLSPALIPTERPPRLLCVGLADDPGSDRIVAALAGLGALCAVAGPKGSFAAQSRYTHKVFPTPNGRLRSLRGLALARRLEEVVEQWRPDVILPLDDLSGLALRDPRLYAQSSPALKQLIAASLGDPQLFELVNSRRSTMRLARANGLLTPRETDAPTLAHARWAVDSYGYPVVVKRDFAGAGCGVAIVSERGALAPAYLRLWRDAQLRRLIGWARGFRASAPRLTVQEFIPGDLACRISACADGCEREGMDFLVVNRDPLDTGPGCYVQAIQHAEMAETARRMIMALRCSGVVSLDFVISPGGRAYLIGFNPRPVAAGHLGALFGHDIYAAALGQPPARPPSSAAPPETIALFPRAIDREPTSPLLKAGGGVFHDVPWEDAGALEVYRRWLDRRHPEYSPMLGDCAPPEGVVAPQPEAREIRQRFHRFRSAVLY